MTGRLMLRVLMVVPLTLLPLVACIDTVPVQTPAIPARVEPPYTLMDDEKRTYIQGGGEIPSRGDGPWTGYAYILLTQPHFFDKNLYLRLVIPPGEQIGTEAHPTVDQFFRIEQGEAKFVFNEAAEAAEHHR